MVALVRPTSRVDSLRRLGIECRVATLEDKDNTFRWLNAERTHCWSSWSRVSPEFEFLWDDPRFAEFMEKRNLPWPRPSNE